MVDGVRQRSRLRSLRWWLRRVRLSTTRLAVFIVFVCLSILALEGWRSWTDYETDIAQAQRAMVNLARSLAQHAEDTLELADTAIVGIAARLREDGRSPERIAALNRIMAVRVAALPRVDGIFIFDEGGRQIGSSRPPLSQPMPGLGNEPYFLQHRDHAERRALIGPVVAGPAGGWFMTVSRRFDLPDSSFGGVVVATIDVEYFATHYAQFAIGREGVVASSMREACC